MMVTVPMVKATHSHHILELLVFVVGAVGGCGSGDTHSCPTNKASANTEAECLL